MSARQVAFASAQIEDVLAHLRSMGSGARERLVFCAAMGILIACVAVWALFFRKSRRKRHRHHHGHHSSQAAANDAVAEKSEGDPAEPPKRLKWRRPRRDHRPRNPTLAETGGLPPVREGDPPEILP
jgi:hypothetical protein